MTMSVLAMKDADEDPVGALGLAENAPVLIIDDGRPAYVLMTYDDFMRLAVERARSFNLPSRREQKWSQESS